MEPARADETISKAIAWWKGLRKGHRTCIKAAALIAAFWCFDAEILVIVYCVVVASICLKSGLNPEAVHFESIGGNTERNLFRFCTRFPSAVKIAFWGIIIWLLSTLRSDLVCVIPNPRDPSVGWLSYPLLIYGFTIAALIAARYCRPRSRNRSAGCDTPEESVTPAGTTTSAGSATSAGSNASRPGTLANDVSFSTFMLAFVGSIASLSFAPNNCASWIAHWLTSSAWDAHMSTMRPFVVNTIEIHSNNLVRVIPPPYESFEVFVRIVFFAILLMLLTSPAIRLSALLATFIRRLPPAFSPVAVAESFLISSRLPCSRLTIREGAAWFKNMARTFWWLLFCYVALFWLVGMCPGPLGDTIAGWIEFSIRDATNNQLPLNAENFHSLRLFLASIFALYGTVPVAVTALTALPMGKPRQATVNADGILFARGPFLSLLCRPFRLWSDVKDLQVVGKFNAAGIDKTKLRLSFFSGGHVDLRANNMSDGDLEQFMGAIDEHAAYCNVTDDVLDLRKAIRERMGFHAVLQNQFRSASASDFRSTIFQPLKVGDKLPGNRGRVVRLLSSKPLAAVYVCRLACHELAVVKQFYLATDNAETSKLKKAFTREYDLLSKLSHPALSKVIETFIDEESTFLTLQYSSGTDLRKLVAELGPRPEALVRSWAEQLCNVVSYLHAQDPAVLHRDITPDNIIVDNDGRLRLIDFGAAHQFLEGITGTMIGKQCYVSPEQLRGNASPRSDIYSIGCTLYFLLTGKDPVPLAPCQFSDETNVSVQFQELIRLCTEFDEQDRPQTISEFLEQLQAGDLPQTAVQRLLDRPEYFELDETVEAVEENCAATVSSAQAGAPHASNNTYEEDPLRGAEEERKGEEDDGQIISVKTENLEKQSA